MVFFSRFQTFRLLFGPEARMSPITVLLLVPVLKVPDSLQDFLFILYEHIPGSEEDYMEPSA